MHVFEAMSKDPRTVVPRMSVHDAAIFMERFDIGMLPVVDSGRAVGVVTDRDIAIRAVAAGRDPLRTTVSQIMTSPVVQVNGAETLEGAITVMMEHRISRILVVDDTGNLVGVLSASDTAVHLENNWDIAAMATLVARRDREHSNKVLGRVR